MSNANQLILARCPVTIEAREAAAGKKAAAAVMIDAYTGGAMRVAGWNLPVVIDTANLKLPPKIPLVIDHALSMATLAGQGEASIENGSVKITGTIAIETPAGKLCADHARAGVELQASVGMVSEKWRDIAPNESVRVNGRTVSGPKPWTLIETGTLIECSLVPRGADAQTRVKIAASKQPTKGSKRMDPTITIEGADTGEGLDDHDPVKLERKRVAAITKLAAKYETGGPKIAATAVEQGWDLNKAELEMIRAERPQKSPTQLAGRSVAAAGVDDSMILATAACLNLGMSEKFLADQIPQSQREVVMNAAASREMRGTSIHSICRVVLNAAGKNPNFSRVTPDVLTEVFEAGAFLRANGFSSLSLPGILSNIANKSLLMGYSQAATTWRFFCAVESNKDFKQATRYRLTGNGALAELAPGGEIEHITLDEASFNNTVKTEAAMLGLTRTQLVNDDLGALNNAGMILSRLAAIALERAVFAGLMDNASFFTSGNNNYIEGATVGTNDSRLNIEGLTRAESAFVKQVDSNGDPILITPSVLLTPPELSAAAAALTRSVEVRNNDAEGDYPVASPHAGKFTPITSPYLSNTNYTGYSAAAWYLLGSPNNGPAAMEVAFLNGQQTPMVETSSSDFNTLGVQLRVVFDFGVAKSDYRAGLKSKGAA